MRYMRLSTNERGLSLVELMVAMVLGLLITAAVLQLFLTNRQTFNLQQGLASIQEQGRFAVDFFSREMMSAGYGNVSSPFAITQAVGDDEGNNLGKSEDGDRYDSVRLLLASGPNDESLATRCSGAEIPENTSAWKHYSVEVNDDGNGVLRCQDDNGNINVLIDNVEAFQVLYGVAPNQDESIAATYKPASSVVASDKIVSIRYGLVIASDGVATSEREGIADYYEQLFFVDPEFNLAEKIDFEDGRLRRLFVSTVALRNLAGE